VGVRDLAHHGWLDIVSETIFVKNEKKSFSNHIMLIYDTPTLRLIEIGTTMFA
jgi:hypothetical protein